MPSPITLVLGASANPDRYAYRAIRMLRQQGYPVVAVGNSAGMVDDITITTQLTDTIQPDTITLYLNTEHQKLYYDSILKLKPRRVLFNPGAENPEFENLLKQNNIEPIEACTLVLLSTHQY